jgi:hypothetical protein
MKAGVRHNLIWLRFTVTCSVCWAVVVLPFSDRLCLPATAKLKEEKFCSLAKPTTRYHSVDLTIMAYTQIKLKRTSRMNMRYAIISLGFQWLGVEILWCKVTHTAGIKLWCFGTLNFLKYSPHWKHFKNRNSATEHREQLYRRISLNQPSYNFS